MARASDDARVALVTGANRGIGLEVCRQLAGHGLRVILTGRDGASAEAAAADLRRTTLDVTAATLDVNDSASIRACEREVAKQFGRVDVLVNNAAVLVGEGAALLRIPVDELRTTFETNLHPHRKRRIVLSVLAVVVLLVAAVPTKDRGVYRAKTLKGIWATAPYLHNGSVPTIYDLLLPVDERPKTFRLGTREYDPQKLGYGTEGARFLTPPNMQPFVLDTHVLGNWNTGHEWWFYAGLTDANRYEIIEFLKRFTDPGDYRVRAPGRVDAARRGALATAAPDAVVSVAAGTRCTDVDSGAESTPTAQRTPRTQSIRLSSCPLCPLCLIGLRVGAAVDQNRGEGLRYRGVCDADCFRVTPTRRIRSASKSVNVTPKRSIACSRLCPASRS
jgi:hypothetical protein